LEVYNENVYDLLGANVDNRIPMKIKEENGNVVVKGLREIQIRSLKEAQKILQYGQANRQTAETNVNLDSSRSHSIFNIRLVFQMSRELANGGSETTELSPKFSIVDLAGSERSSRSQTTGLRLKEASNINVSLMTLGRCLEALKWNCDHPNAQPHIVPFRQSKLTRIFQQWFVAQSRMVMLVNVSAAAADFDEMTHALRYGAIAKNIVIRSKVQSRHAIMEAVSEQDQPANSSDCSESTPLSQAPQIDMDDVLLEMQQLRTALYEAETRCAQVEQKVREEVTEEMEAQMKEMDLVFAIRIENERIAVEER
jgi:kinesin family protein 20